MATVAVRGSAVIGTNGTTWATTTNAVDGAVGVNNATYATYTNATASAVAYIELGTFGFSSTIGASDTINSVTVNLRHFENNTGRFTSVRFQPYDGVTAIGSLFTATLATAARNDSTTFTVTAAQLRSSTFLIRVVITGAASTQSRVESIDYVDVTVDYTPLAPTITQAAYRWYADGTETGSTALATQDTGYTADTSGGDVNLQLRVRLQSTNAGTIPSTDDWQLQYELNTSGTWNNAAAEGLVDSYTTTPDSWQNLTTISYTHFGQSFMGNGNNLTRARFQLRSIGTPPAANIRAELYAHTGTFGSSSTATGSPLATSTTTVPTSSLSTSGAWFEFTFDGTYTLTAATPYVVIVTTDVVATASSDCTQFGRVVVSPTAAGNVARRTNAGTWSADSSDANFEVYAQPSSLAVIQYDSANLTDAAATTNRLGSGSGSFIAGKISEDSVVDDFGWTANNYTELLYSITLKQSGLAGGDTIAFRVLRNAATTGMTYTATPAITISTGGSATASPAVIARSVTIPAVTPQAGSVLTPALIARSVAVPAATGSANALPTPALIARSVTLDAPTPLASSTTAPALIARSATLPAPTTTAQTNGTATPGVISATATMPAPTTAAGSAGVPAVIARTVTVDVVTPQASSTTTPALIARTAVVPAATGSGESAGNASPAVIARSATMPAPTPQAGSTLTPAVIARSVALPAPTTSAGVGATAAPAVIARTVAVPATTTTGGLGAIAAPAVIARTVTLDAPTPQVSKTTSPALIARTSVMPAPTTSAGLGAIASPAVIARTAAMAAPTPQAGSTLTPATIARAATLGLVSATGASAGTTTPAVIARSVALPAPTPQASTVTSPALIARVVAMPAPTPQAGTVRTVALIARVAVMPTPTASGASAGTASPATIARLVALPNPTPKAGTVVLVAVIARLVVIHQATATAGAAAYQLYYGANQVVALYYGTIPIAGNNAHLG